MADNDVFPPPQASRQKNIETSHSVHGRRKLSEQNTRERDECRTRTNALERERKTLRAQLSKEERELRAQLGRLELEKQALDATARPASCGT